MNMAATAWAADAIAPPVTLPDGSKTQQGAVDKDGKWTLPDGTPTYRITTKDGKIDKLDWYTYSGFRRYHRSATFATARRAKARPTRQRWSTP